ncbi:PA2169 family four-helix-bundle protein [Larkinella humicola]|uniref:PA2169 family four-helix-bundle protein n=2 Tax=Larkinella humicola TaxID=2607654 RepID=A0A5N1J8A5_9BACT|nr:PA2169 family four-helix-bundle protein [Larkinella humicola]
MMTNDEIVDSLNDLVKINNDRINGFEKAAEDIEDAELASLFKNLTSQSRKFRSELADNIVRIGGEVPGVDETSAGSKIHRAWIDIKSAFTGKDRHTVLESCVFGENAAVEEYEETLEDESLPSHIRQTLSTQLDELRQTRDQIATLRDVTE